MASMQIVIYTMNIIALLFLFRLSQGDNLLGNHRKKSFSYAIIITILMIISEIGTVLVNQGNVNLRVPNILFNVLGFSLSPLIPILLIMIFDPKFLKIHKFVLIPTIINFLIVILSPWLKLIFSVDTNNVYHRETFFLVFILVYIFNIILLLIVNIFNSQKHFYPIKWKITALTLLTIIGTCIQLLIPTIYSTWHCVTLILLLLYILLSEFEGSFDGLTNLQNRAAFEKASKLLTGKKAFSVIVMDINHFKQVNDSYGHEYGDVVLKELSKTIQTTFINSCRCYRTGGDEFCIIRRDVDKEQIELQIAAMKATLDEKRKNNPRLPTIAYGYSIFQEDKNLDFQKVLKEADDKMYYHKQLAQQDKSNSKNK